MIGGTNGRPKRADVKRRCECSRCHCTLEAGADCFDIPKVGGAFANSKRVCVECFNKILQQTENDLEELRNL